MTTVQAPADRPSTDAVHRLDVLLLERWERDPGLPAIVHGDTVLTVGELRKGSCGPPRPFAHTAYGPVTAS